MRFKISFYILFLFLFSDLHAQDKDSFEPDVYIGTKQHIDSLNAELLNVKNDTIESDLLYKLSKAFWYNTLSNGIEYANQALTLSEKINYKKGIFNADYSFAVLYLNRGDANISETYCNKSLVLAKELNDKRRIAATSALLSSLYYRLGNLPKGQQLCYSTLKVAEDLHFKTCIIRIYATLGNINDELGNEDEVFKYYSLALKLSNEIDNKIQTAGNSHNLGSYYAGNGEFDKSLTYFSDALKLNNEIGNKLWAAYNNDAIGYVYDQKRNYVLALKYGLESAKILREIKEKLKLSSTLNNIAFIYFNLHDYTNARKIILKSISLAKETNYLSGLYSSYESLVSIDSATGNWKSAYENHRSFIFYRDSVLNKENTKRTVQTAMQYEFDKKESLAKAAQEKKDALALKELQRQRFVRNSFVGGFTIVLLFAAIFFKQRNKIKKGKKLSDDLLLNILPEEVAEELKAKGSTEAKQFEEVTVMFTDFKGFTQISELLSPSELVTEIHTCFKAFDLIITKYNIEKIKTIGDSYMCAGGLPVANKTNAMDVVNAALEIQQFMIEHLRQRKKENKPVFEIRIGVHTGPVVAGIVGVKKFAYDIWGDTVNIASRMESSGEAGKVNISGTTFALVKESFHCIYRGKIEAKNKGETDMYFVERKLY